MFKRSSGEHNVHYFPKTASTAFEKGDLVYFSGGKLIPADNTSGDHAGVIMRAVTAADDDYAEASYVAVDVPRPDDIFEVDVPNGDLAAADVGITCDLDASDPSGIDPDATSKNVVSIVEYVSASKARVKINAIFGRLRVATT